MKKFAVIVLAAVFMQPAISLADSTDSRAKPSSFVPHSRTTTHVYGTPIQPAIASHSTASHHKPTPKKRSPVPKKPG